MLKRTTVYLEESEIETLKNISYINRVSMAELIRKGVQEICKNYSKEQKEALSILTEIKTDASKAGITPRMAMKTALKVQREARRERKTSRN